MSESELKANETMEDLDMEPTQVVLSDEDLSFDELLLDDDDLFRDDESETDRWHNDKYSSNDRPSVDRPVKRWLRPISPFAYRGPDEVSPVQIRVTNVDSTGQIYAHLYENRHHLKQMKSTFAAFYGGDENEIESATKAGQCSKSMKNKIKSSWKENEACVVMYREEWYRGQIVDINYADKKSPASIFLVDIGVYFAAYHRDLEFILRIPYHFGELEILAVRVILDNVGGSDLETGIWPENNLEKLIKFLNYENRRFSEDGCCYAIQTREAHGFPVPVELKIPVNNEWRDLAKKVVEDWSLAVWLPEGQELNLKDSRYKDEANCIEPNIEQILVDSETYTIEMRSSTLFSPDMRVEKSSLCSSTSDSTDDLSLSPWNLANRNFYIGEQIHAEILTFFEWEPYITICLYEAEWKAGETRKKLEKYSDRCLPIIKPRLGMAVTCRVDNKWCRGFILKIKESCTTENAITNSKFILLITMKQNGLKM